MKSIVLLLKNRPIRIALSLLMVPLLYIWPIVYIIGNQTILARLVIIVGVLVSVYYHLGQPITRSRLGFDGAAFIPGLRLALLLTTPVLLIILYAGLELNSLQPRQHPHLDLAALFLWAMAQQWALQTVIFDASRRCFSPTTAILVASGAFAFIHLPNPLLTAGTFAGAVGWCWIYARYPNLIPLALSHSLCSLMMIASLPREITGGMRIGYAYFGA